MPTRCERLRTTHGWSRQQVADYLNLDISTVSRLEARTDGVEPGGTKTALDLLEANPELIPPKRGRIAPVPLGAAS